MAHKPWYEQMAEMEDRNEAENFMRGVFGFRPKERQPVLAMLVAGYIGGKVATKGKK